MSSHTGRRMRVKKRLRESGLAGFSEDEILEAVLFYCFAQGDTHATARNMIKKFGSFRQVIEAPEDELLNVDGVGEATVLYLRLWREVVRHVKISEVRERKRLSSVEECGKYLLSYFFGKYRETVYLLCLDARGGVICCDEICEGGTHSANLSFRTVVDKAIRSNATSVVLAHNHPGGLALPSKEDILITKQLSKLLHMSDVLLADHIIVSEDDFISLYLSGKYNPEMDAIME